MSNVIQIKNGATAPTISNLQPYELGYVRGGSLYINNNGTIAQLTNPKVIGLVNSSNYLVLPAITNANSDTDKFLVCDSNGQVKFRTGANVLSDIGAFPASGGVLITTKGNWGKESDPLPSSGVQGQLYFKLIQE